MDVPREGAAAADAAIEETAPLSFAGPVRLIPGENAVSYDELLARMTGALKPLDFVEEVWVRDLVDVVWDVLRLRRLKASLLASHAHDGVDRVLDLLKLDEAYRISRRWGARVLLPWHRWMPRSQLPGCPWTWSWRALRSLT
jgi:hypothetical protein